MVTCDPSERDSFCSDIAFAKNPRYKHGPHGHHWGLWVCYSASRNQDPRFLHLQGDTHHLECSELLLAFAGSLRQGKLHGGRPPSRTSIKMTLLEVAKFLDSRGLGDPRRSTPGQPFLDTQFVDILRQWKMENPAPRPQQALPSSTIRLIADVYRKSQYKKQRVTADLIVTAYFFLL
jgi:hypothetical protein